MNAIILLKHIENFRKFDADIQSQTIAVFLYVGIHESNEGVPMTKIATDLNMAQSSVSRNVSLLSKWSWSRKEGLNFVEALEDPMERRRKLVKLTNRGKNCMLQLVNITSSIGRRYIMKANPKELQEIYNLVCKTQWDLGRDESVKDRAKKL